MDYEGETEGRTIYTSEGRDSQILDANGVPYKLKDYREPIGFNLRRK